MRRYVIILLALLFLSGCHVDTVPETDIPDTTAHTEETPAEAGTEDTDTVTPPEESLPEKEEDNSESETTTSDTSEETEAEAELPPGVICYSQQLYVDADPPYRYLEDESNLPDFLTEEQNILYRQAQTAFIFFNGDPGLASFIVIHKGESVSSNLVKMENGYSYFNVIGKYQKWEDFKSMILNVFTEEYFQELNHMRNYEGTDIEIFIERDGDAYGLAIDRIGLGGAPTTFELHSMTDEEIRFTATYRYEPRDDPEWSEKETVYRTAEIILQNTENGWRFTKYNCAGWYRKDPLDY